MEQTKKELSKAQPTYKADGVAVWVNTDKNGKPYLAIKVVGMNTIHAFANTPKNEGGDSQ